MYNMNHRLVYERDEWYDEYILDDDTNYIDDGSIIYANGITEKVKTALDKDAELLGVTL